ncbi:hypothetical protein [Marinobacter sp. LV10R510-11A]|uniref:hypothetical protein n=1 Tax=Marinobacter sp. LV10R510-11A TaxID=1415568 RepID=UPI0012FE5A1A|nr:hypothetical protein [Marinobacter sp. LV10R510-11A]
MLDPRFAAAFWDFVVAGDYEICQKGNGERTFPLGRSANSICRCSRTGGLAGSYIDLGYVGVITESALTKELSPSFALRLDVALWEPNKGQLLIYAALAFIFVGGSRMSMRMLVQYSSGRDKERVGIWCGI